MKISDYVPILYKPNVEMNSIINAEEIELEQNIKPDIDNVFKDTFIAVATENGIDNFEQLLGISSDKTEESLEFRRERVINRLRSSIPFTEKFLQDSLDNYIGEGNWSYTINHNTYEITINSLKPGNAWYRELLNFLDSIIPCNMQYTIVLFAATWQQVEDTFGTWEALEEMTWEEVLNGEWIHD